MLSNRSLFYVTLPSLAVLLGLVWYRRKKPAHCDTGGQSCTVANSNVNQINNKVQQNLNTNTHKLRLVDNTKSESLPIANGNCGNSDGTGSSSDSGSGIKTPDSCKLGKSAPIDIAPNSKNSPPLKLNDHQIDAEILKLKIKDSELKTLKSIEEQEDFGSSSPLDLPGSYDRKRFLFSQRPQEPAEKPIIIKATSAAKVSPKDSFLENQYTEECNSQTALPPPTREHERKHTQTSVVQTQSVAVANQFKMDEQHEGERSEQTNVTRNPPIASPPLSLCSFHSTDSGKGSSPPHSEGAPTTTYGFLLPQILVGQVIGHKGIYVHQIKIKTGASVVIKNQNRTSEDRLCVIEGTEQEIAAALSMIRSKLPKKKYPTLTLKRVPVAAPQTIVSLASIDTSCLRLQLIEGINNDVMVSSVVSGGHLFVHQPLHPSYPSLKILSDCMNQSYGIGNTPSLPKPTEDAICVVPIQNSWYRVQLITHNPKMQSCLVKYLDFGGYVNVMSSDLRQIRTDFMTVPFQAIECLLSNIKPIGGGHEWSTAAAETLNMLTQNLILQAQVAGYSVDGLPEVYLYAYLAPDNVIFINQELVARGLAEWIEDSELVSVSS